MEATRVNLSFSQTSMVPNFVPANMKSLLMATRWMSSPVESDPTTILEESENILHQLKEKLVQQERILICNVNNFGIELELAHTFPAVASTEEPQAKRKPS